MGWGRGLFILGGNSCSQYISFPIGLSECPLTVGTVFDRGRRAGVGAMDTLRSLPGPSQLLPPPQEAPAPQASPVSSPALFSSPELPWLVQMGRGPGAACGLKASCPLPFPPGLIAAGSTVPLPGLGLGCGDSHLCQRGKHCQGGRVTDRCDRLSDRGTPTQGLSPAALTSVPPVPCVCGFGYQVQGRGAW